MPAVREDSFGVGNQRWLGSTHGLYNAQSGNLDISAFTEADHYPDGYLVSGIPLAKASATDKFVPYAAGGTGGAGTLVGFLVTDQPVHNADEDINAPVLMHGFVNVDHLPVDGFTAPTGTAFVFRGQGV